MTTMLLEGRGNGCGRIRREAHDLYARDCDSGAGAVMERSHAPSFGAAQGQLAGKEDDTHGRQMKWLSCRTPCALPKHTAVTVAQPSFPTLLTTLSSIYGYGPLSSVKCICTHARSTLRVAGCGRLGAAARIPLPPSCSDCSSDGRRQHDTCATRRRPSLVPPAFMGGCAPCMRQADNAQLCTQRSK